MPDYLEQRKSIRFNGEIPIELKQGTGLTRNCSADGIYFVTDQSLSVGERIELVMLLDHIGLGHTVRLRCTGEVLRLKPEAELNGVAFTFTSQVLDATEMMAQTTKGGDLEPNHFVVSEPSNRK
ncbi:MAG TPA: PilZ domain-containing protein [Nitrospirota bacterium]